MRAKGIDLLISLRMIKRKKNQLKESLKVAGETAYCSMKKAFSSMVFMIRELHSQSLQMREQLFYEDLQGILVRVQSEMHGDYGRLGLGSVDSQWRPVVCSAFCGGGDSVRSVACGGAHTLFLTGIFNLISICLELACGGRICGFRGCNLVGGERLRRLARCC
ncbi:hypothetical protein RND81_05G053100 [Saponaria officinalis]|uniref:Uncharacterized protein n=1 Tax=Saponaria officinalis TaxID=3572 RepID=A0AAW1KUC5_SAPOF